MNQRETSAWRRAAVAVATVVGVAAMANLGLWQLDRAGQKRARHADIEAKAQAAVLLGADVPRGAREAESSVHRRVRLRGQWLAEATVYLDNRQMDGRHGFIVVTPLRLDGESDALLVQRGWVPRHAHDRAQLPVVVTSAGTVDVDGVIAPAPARLFEFEQGGSGPIRQNLDVAAFAAETGIALRPYSVLQSDTDATAGDRMLRRWVPPALDAHKNYGYAVQWFSLAALMAGLYVWFQLIRPWRRCR